MADAALLPDQDVPQELPVTEQKVPEQDAILLAAEQTVSDPKEKSGCGILWCLLMCGPQACHTGRRFMWFGQPLEDTEKAISSWLHHITTFNFLGALACFYMLLSPTDLLKNTNSSVVRWFFAYSKCAVGFGLFLFLSGVGIAPIIKATLMAAPKGRLRYVIRRFNDEISAPGGLASMGFTSLVFGIIFRLLSQNLASLDPTPVPPSSAISMTPEDIGLFVLSSLGFVLGICGTLYRAWVTFKMWQTSFHSSEVMGLLDLEANQIETNIRKET